MTILGILLFVIAGWTALGIIGTIVSVGKERKPLTGGVATFSVFVSFGFIIILALSGIQLIGI